MPTLAPERTGQTYRLPDGRVLGFAECGDRGGRPLFYFHGWPSSRIEFAGLNGDEIARQLHLRVLAVDPPGFGLSSYQPRHTFTGWPVDISRLADHLGFERFAVLGYSASSPYTLACAHALSNRLTAVCVVSGVAQPSGASRVGRVLLTTLIVFIAATARRFAAFRHPPTDHAAEE